MVLGGKSHGLYGRTAAPSKGEKTGEGSKKVWVQLSPLGQLQGSRGHRTKLCRQRSSLGEAGVSWENGSCRTWITRTQGPAEEPPAWRGQGTL